MTKNSLHQARYLSDLIRDYENKYTSLIKEEKKALNALEKTTEEQLSSLSFNLQSNKESKQRTFNTVKDIYETDLERIQNLHFKIKDTGYSVYIQRHQDKINPANIVYSERKCERLINDINDSIIPQSFSQISAHLCVPAHKNKYETIYNSILYLENDLKKKLKDLNKRHKTEKNNLNIEYNDKKEKIITDSSKQKKQIKNSYSIKQKEYRKALSESVSFLNEEKGLFFREANREKSICKDSGFYNNKFTRLANTTITLNLNKENKELYKNLFSNKYKDRYLFLPIYEEAADNQSIIFKYDCENSAIVSITDKIFASLTASRISNYLPGMLKTYIFDSSNFGNAYRSFYKLEHTDCGGNNYAVNIIRSETEISKHLDKIINNMIKIQSQCLNENYNTIYDYNKTGNHQEAYSLIVINDFPRSYKVDDYQKILKIIENSQRCGITVLIGATDNELWLKNKNYEYFMQKINEQSKNNKIEVLNHYSYSDDFIVCKSHGTALSFSPTMNTEQISAMAEETSSLISNKKQQLPVSKLLNLDNIWSKKSDTELSLSIGYLLTGNKYDFRLFENNSYALIAGEPRSGKSTLLHTICLSAITSYSPEELQIHVCDLKKGREFSQYFENKIPHFRLLLTDESGQAAVDYLTYLQNEINKRNRIFEDASKIAGQNIEKYEKYREFCNQHESIESMPRLLVIIDEFQTMFSTDTTNSVKAANNLRMLCRMGATYGIYLMMASQQTRQSDSKSTFNSDLKDYFTTRIAMRCSIDEAKKLMGESCIDAKQNDALSRTPTLLTGTAIINDKRGTVNAANRYVNIAYTSDEDRKNIFSLIKESSMENNYSDSIIIDYQMPVQLNCETVNKYKLTSLNTENELLLGRSNRVCFDSSTDNNDQIKDDNFISVVLENEPGNNILLAGNDTNSRNCFLYSIILNSKYNHKFNYQIMCLNSNEKLIDSLMKINPDIKIIRGKESIIKAMQDKSSENIINIILDFSKMKFFVSQSSLRIDRNSEAAIFQEYIRSSNFRNVYNIVIHENFASLKRTFKRDFLDEIFKFRISTPAAKEIIQQTLTYSGNTSYSAISNWILSASSQPKLMYGNIDTAKTGTMRPFNMDNEREEF